MQHYFSEKPNSKSERKEISFNFHGKNFLFITDNGVFSKEHVDEGTIILIESFLEVNNNEDFSILDIGCGYGVVATTIKSFHPNCRITLSDINERAIELSVENLKKNNISKFNIVKSDLFEKIKGSFDVIISNPPIRAGKKTIFNLYQKSYEYLNNNGRFFCVIMTKHGAKSTEKELNNIFKEVKCIKIKKGYRVYEAIK